MVDKNRKHLEALISREVTKLFESALDYTQVACPQETFKALRSKILRVGNGCIRSINSKLSDYDIKYIAKNEDVISVCKKQ